MVKAGTGNVMNVCSPVFDLTTEDVWRLFSATDFPVSEIYDKMYESGIAIENQRVGSLLNFAATRNIASIKTLEPDMYARINARFQNVEFMAQFGKSGYYNIGKPKPIEWNGRNHIKAGVPEEEVKELTDIYEEMLKAQGIRYERRGNEFEFPKDSNSLVLVPDRPLEDAVKNGAELSYAKDKEEMVRDAKAGKIIDSLRIIKTTWKDYCLYMLNTTNEPIKSIWREKMVTSILSWKYGTGSVEYSTIDALKVLTGLDSDYTMKIVDDYWEEDDWKVFGRLNISGKFVLSLSKYPQESLEKEALLCIEDIVERRDMDMLKSSPRLYELALMWNRQGGKSLTPLEAMRNYIGGKFEKVEIEEIENPPEVGSEGFWDNVLSAANIWFKENIHSTSSWKRFCVAILKNDVTLKYLGFAPTTKERVARAQAISAFSSKKEEREKAKKQAQKLAKKLEQENKELQKN